MEKENSYLSENKNNEGMNKKMLDVKTNFDAAFEEMLNLTANEILNSIENDAYEKNLEEKEIPESRGQILTLVSSDGINETKAFKERMKGNRLHTGPITLHSKAFCIFH